LKTTIILIAAISYGEKIEKDCYKRATPHPSHQPELPP